MVELPSEFHTTPLAVYVWSRSPRAAQVLAFAIAKFSDPAFRWMSVRAENRLPSEEEVWVHRMLPPERIMEPLAESDLGQGPRLLRTTFDALVRPEGAEADRIALDHFFLLPERLQRMLDETPTGPGPRAVVIANTNRIRQFYPADPDLLRAYTDVFPRGGFSMITTSVPPPYKGRYGFNVVLRMDALSPEGWRDADLVVEKGFREGDFRTGASYSAREIPWYRELGDAVTSSTG